MCACKCNTVSYVLRVRSISSTYNAYTESNIYIYIYCNRIFHEQTADISGRKPCGSNPI